MIFTTQKAALCHALLNGERVSIMDGFRKFGMTNLPREISRQIEQAFNVQVKRFRCKSKTRYGHSCSYIEYQLVPSNKKHSFIYTEKQQKIHNKGIVNMRKYIDEHTAKEEYKGWMNEHERSAAKFYADQAAKRVIPRCDKTTEQIVREAIYTKQQISEQKRKKK